MASMKIPEDEEQRNIIDKLANFVARNGPKFEELTKSKQKDNPKFGFLFGGDYHEYYKWKVSLETTQAQAQKKIQENTQVQPVPPTAVQPTPAVPTTETPTKPVNQFDLTEFRDLVQKLILACTKDNIQNGKNWIINNAKTDNQLKLSTEFLLRRLLEEVLPFQQKLHIVYLANDILHHSRKKELPQLQEAVQYFILPIIAVTYNGESDENHQKLTKVLKIWDTQKFFSDEIREKLRYPAELYDANLDVMEEQRNEMDEERKRKEEIEKEEQRKQEEEKQKEVSEQQMQGFDIYPQQQPQPQEYEPPLQGQYQQFHQYGQWNAQQEQQPPPPPPPPPGGQPDTYQFFGQQFAPRQPFEQPRPGFPPYQQGFPPGGPSQGDQGSPGAFEQGPPPGQAGYQAYEMQHQYQPPPQVQTFDYSHQSVPGIEQGVGGPAPVTFDYEHGRAPVPDGAQPIHEDMHDPTIPLAPYYDLPAGLMVPLVKLWDCEYRPLDPKDLRLPIPQPPSERLLAAVEAFYAPPSHDRPRDSQGWEKNGLFEFYKAKLKYIKDKDRKLEIIERSPSPPPSRSVSPESDGSPLVKDRPPRSRSNSKSPPPRARSRSRSRSREKKRSLSRSRSRSVSRSPRRIRSKSRSKSKSRSRSPPHRSPVRRSPTPPEGFVGFEAKSLESRIEETNVGHQLLKKMGWGGQGLGKKESGILDPIKQGEVRDRQDKFKGIGVDMNDPFENYRKTKSYTFGRPRERKR